MTFCGALSWITSLNSVVSQVPPPPTATLPGVQATKTVSWPAVPTSTVVDLTS